MTKLPRTFVLRYIPCDCNTHKGCFRCQFTGYRVRHVPLEDALKELEEAKEPVPEIPTVGGEPALLTPHSARQSGAQVGDRPYSDAERGVEWNAGPEKETPDCVHCGWPSQNMAVVKRIGPCLECGHGIYRTIRPLHPNAKIANDGALYAPSLYGGLECARCGTKMP